MTDPEPEPAAQAQPERHHRPGVFLGTWRGIRFYLDYSWFIIAAIVVYILSTSLFPAHLPGHSQAVHLALGVVGAALFFFSIVLHELGHSVVSQRCGIPVPSIRLLFIGGIAEISREPDDARSELRIALAGPVVSLLLVMAYLGLGWMFSLLGVEPVSLMFLWLAQVNLILVLFNAIPGYPLDGGRVLRALLWMRNGKLREATYITSRIGALFSMVLIIGGVLMIFAYAAWNGLVFILIGVFLKNAAESGYSQTVYQEVLGGVPVSALMTRDPIGIPEHLPLNLVVDDYFLTNHHVAFPVVDGEGRCQGLLRLEFLQQVPREKWPYTQAGDLVASAGGERLRVPEATRATDALRRLLATGQGRLAVTDAQGRLTGIVTRHDLLHFIRVHTELAGEEPRSPA